MSDDLFSYINFKFRYAPNIKALAMDKQNKTVGQAIGGFTLPPSALMTGSYRPGGTAIGAYYKNIYKILANGKAELLKVLEVTPQYYIESESKYTLANLPNLKNYIDTKANNRPKLIDDIAFGKAIRVAAHPDGITEHNKYFLTRFEVQIGGPELWVHLRPLMFKLQGENIWRI